MVLTKTNFYEEERCITGLSTFIFFDVRRLGYFCVLFC